MSGTLPKNVVEYLTGRIEDNDCVTLFLNDDEKITLDAGYFSIYTGDGCVFDYPAYDDVYINNDNLVIVAQLGWFEQIVNVPLEQIVDFDIEE